jgi:hypothetical protein
MTAARTGSASPRAPSGAGRGHLALVTGASSGIGRAMSQVLAAKGYDVVVLARRTARLEELAQDLHTRWGVRAIVLTADLSESDAPARITEELQSQGLVIDFLVNNAAYTQIGHYGDLDWAEHERRIRVLALAPLELTHRLLPGMRERGWGRILNIGSIAGCFAAYPRDVLYCATKTMIEKFTEGLAAEYADQGILCTVSIPGFTDTEIYDSSGFGDHVRSQRSYRLAMMRPETVANQAYTALMAGRRQIVHGPHHKIMAGVLQHLPLPWRRALAVSISGNIRADSTDAERANR